MAVRLARQSGVGCEDLLQPNILPKDSDPQGRFVHE